MTRHPTRRGERPGRDPAAWRLDGAAPDGRAPLLLALHGMGMHEDMLGRLLQTLFDLPLHVLIPRAPHPLVSHGEGRPGASWYAYDGDQARFRRELLRTEAGVLAVLRHAEEAQGLAPRARVLFGFSQGGYAGAFIALRRRELFGGLIVSGARVKHEFLEEEIAAAGQAGFAALLLHGREDRSVPAQAAEFSYRALAGGGVRTTLRLVEGGHALGREQVRAMRQWLTVELGLDRR